MLPWKAVEERINQVLKDMTGSVRWKELGNHLSETLTLLRRDLKPGGSRDLTRVRRGAAARPRPLTPSPLLFPPGNLMKHAGDLTCCERASGSANLGRADAAPLRVAE